MLLYIKLIVKLFKKLHNVLSHTHDLPFELLEVTNMTHPLICIL